MAPAHNAQAINTLQEEVSPNAQPALLTPTYLAAIVLLALAVNIQLVEQFQVAQFAQTTVPAVLTTLTLQQYAMDAQLILTS
jgi:hypothetical protein